MHNLYDANKCERYKVAEMKKYKDMSKDELLTLKAYGGIQGRAGKGPQPQYGKRKAWILPAGTFHADVR